MKDNTVVSFDTFEQKRLDKEKAYQEERQKKIDATRKERERSFQRRFIAQWSRWLKFTGKDPKDATAADSVEFNRVRGNKLDEDPWLKN